MIQDFFHSIVEFAKVHHVWAPPIVFLLAFCESLAFVSLVLPAWGALVAVGALVAAGSLDFLPLWIAASVGAALGDWLSYWIGRRYKGAVGQMWPFTTHPNVLRRGEEFFLRWGAPGVFLGRFTGPLRAAVPIVAGMFSLQPLPFQIANWTSAFVRAAVCLLIVPSSAFLLKFLG